jgi:hypothetical protein
MESNRPRISRRLLKLTGVTLVVVWVVGCSPGSSATISPPAVADQAVDMMIRSSEAMPAQDAKTQAKLESQGAIKIVGAMYDVKTGQIVFMDPSEHASN